MKNSSENQKETRRYDVPLESKEHNLTTKADCIIFNHDKKEAYPVQHKYSFKPKIVYNTYLAQLMMEALMIEEQFSTRVPYGFMKFEKSGETIKIDLTEKRKVFESIEGIRNIVENETFPEPTNWRKRCIDCGYKKMCWG